MTRIESMKRNSEASGLTTDSPDRPYLISAQDLRDLLLLADKVKAFKNTCSWDVDEDGENESLVHGQFSADLFWEMCQILFRLESPVSE